MVKIAIKKLLLSLVIFIFLMNVAYAARQALDYSDVDVKVGSKTSKNLKDGNSINEEAEPGDGVEFRVELKNNYTSAENLEIEDISVEVTIEGIDDGDDLDDEAKEFDLKAGSDKRVTIKFDVPIEVEEGSFNVKIEAEGRDENGTRQSALMKLKLEVEKENHMLKITKKTLTPAEIACNRKNVQLGVTVINIGNEDEEDITFHVLSPDLKLEVKENIGELEAEPNEDTSRFSKIYTFSVPNSLEAGSYPISLRALYDNDRRKAEETVSLTVNDCKTTTTTTDEEEEEEEEVEEEEVEEEEEEEEVTVPTGSTTGTTTTTTVPEGFVVTEEGFLSGNAFIVGIIIAEVVAVIVGIVLLVSLFTRR